jgi:hypothetical protein
LAISLSKRRHAVKIIIRANWRDSEAECPETGDSIFPAFHNVAMPRSKKIRSFQFVKWGDSDNRSTEDMDALIRFKMSDEVRQVTCDGQLFQHNTVEGVSFGPHFQSLGSWLW